MSYFSKRALRWAAPVALVSAVGLAACGNSDDSEAIKVAAPSAVGAGSDQHLSNKAAEIGLGSASAGSDQHLNNKAAEIAGASVGAGSDQHLNNRAAEIASQRANRAGSARLTGQAEQLQRVEAARPSVLAQQERAYRSAAVPTNSDANLPNVFEAGNRAIQMTQSPAYVWQQQHRTDSNAAHNS